MARDLHPRFVADRIEAALGDTPVVAVNGARQVGKSTLVGQIARERPGSTVVTLDDEVQREAASADPRGFVDRDGLLVIDEVQRVPDLLPAIKAAVDRDRRPGRFLLTGSTRLLSTVELADALAGRVELVELWPLSAGELRGNRESFLEALLAWEPSAWRDSTLRPDDYASMICAGGYPEPLTRVGRRRSAWFTNYATTVLERMVTELAHVERLEAMPRLLRLCAARTACELNVMDLTNDAGLPYRTVGTYLAHLEHLFLVQRVPAWSRNLTSKVARHPKLLMVDSGLAADLLGTDAAGLASRAASVGQLTETFVAMEIRKQLAWADFQAELFHFRDRGGTEVDLVLETRGGKVAGIEVKSTTTVRRGDFKGLHLLQERLGDQFLGGVVLHRGTDAAPFGDRLAAVPIDALWNAP
ncbi:MAG: ATP-binding protein [Actinobacteria bacterium]|nr:ATP-binding protein [Actinomycetota bacterium]